MGSLSFRELDDVFLQSQARIWLGEVLHTRFDERISICDQLADGELLYEVSKALWNMLLLKYMELKSYKSRLFVPVETRKSIGRYRPYSNIDSFFKVCKVMGLSGVDLFSPSDVVEKRNTRKVCVCIRSLSTKARAKQLNVPDFDIVTNTIAMPTDVVRCIRRSLELSMPRVTCGQSKHEIQKTCYALYKEEDGSSLDEAKTSFPDISHVPYLESPNTVDKYALQEYDATNRELDGFAHTQGPILMQYVNSGNQLDEILFCESGFIISDEFTSINHGENHQNMGEADRYICLSDMISNGIITNPETSPNVLGGVLDFDFDFDDLTTSTYDKASGLCNHAEQVSELSTDSLSPCCSVDQDLESLNCKKDLGHSLVLVKDVVTNVAYNMQENVAVKVLNDDLMIMADPKSNHSIDGVYLDRVGVKSSEDTSKAAACKDERTDDGLPTNKKRALNMAPMLKTVAKGTALTGVLFLLHLRNRRNTNSKSSQIYWKSNGSWFSKWKEEKANKIYPIEKFKFLVRMKVSKETRYTTQPSK